jgi:hypothetical protein
MVRVNKNSKKANGAKPRISGVSGVSGVAKMGPVLKNKTLL